MGQVEYVNLIKKTSKGDSKGYAFVQYTDSHDARAAFDRMNGYVLGGLSLKLELVTDDSGHISLETRPALRTTTDQIPTNHTQCL